MYSKLDRQRRRVSRSHYRKRGKLPFRLVVSRKNRNFHVQLIDDIEANTLYHVSTLSKGFCRKGGVLNSAVVGDLAEYFVKHIPESLSGSKVVFDCGASAYHGLVALFAERVRECLEF
ncbi:ribosomal L18p/L5e family protein [Neorickettsia helminthoeca str. Oregon]|uniref:Ribosomal L18p/L5e family protein n=1 Tax=Neorickettsia helminthoeca str. Oregon TaxID=1286528 RepID=X5HLG1_9RICK|nr:50S ribosomal protein L18 [Neorickettsia helminthoeca]AHX11225.1 ribosomal L18p/L5e family protein [Neorickettsia helminthoeca str. Oregon]